MTSNEDLNRLFEAALGEKAAPSRFGTPEEMKKFSPVPMQQAGGASAAQPSRFHAVAPTADAFEAAPAPAHVSPKAFQAVPPQDYRQPQDPAQVFQPAPAAYAPVPVAQASETYVQLDDKAVASLGSGLSTELGAILDAKVAKEKRNRRLSLVFTLLFLAGIGGGATAWVVTNPERFEAMKAVIAEIKSAGDLKGMVAKYQKALDRIAVRGEQINDATVAMGVDPASAEDMADQGFDKEMREMMGEDGGPTSASRNAKLTDKFDHVKEGGSLIKQKPASGE